VGVAYGYVSTRLKLATGGTSQDGDFVKHAATASLDRRIGDRWTLSGMLGATIAGSLQAYGQSFDVSPGPLATVAASFRALDEGDVAPFVLLTGSLGASLSWTHPGSASLLSFDGRVGVAAGKTIAHVVTPYLLARAFGLPVLWSNQGASVVANDAYHYQLGGGLVVRVGALDLLVEGVPLGERAVVGGAGWAF
jgi:hypothetical protein